MSAYAATFDASWLPDERNALDPSAPKVTPVTRPESATTADDILNRIFSTFCIGK